MPLLDHAPFAAQAQLVSDCAGTDLTASCSALTNWPTGAGNGKFYVTFGRGTPNEQRDLVASRSGNTLTFASTGDRGVEGGPSVLQPTGTTVSHGFSMQEAKDANDHIFDWTRDDHPQYHTAARHAVVSHTLAMMGANSVGASQIVDLSVGTAELAALAVTTAKIADANVTTVKIADNNVTTAKILDANVTTAKILDQNVTTAKITDLNVTSAKLGAASVIAGKIAAGGVSATNQIADAIVTLVKMASEASQTWAVTFTNPTGNFVLGGGTQYAHYFKLGRIVVGWAGFVLGGTGNITAGADVEVSLPVAVASHRGFVAARAADSSSTIPWSGTGRIVPATSIASSFSAAGVATVWGSLDPFNWDPSDAFDMVFLYEAAA